MLSKHSMGFGEQRWRSIVAGLALLTGCVCFTGCQTAKDPLFTTSGSGWRVQQGQALWRPGRNYPELGGEVIVARNPDGRCMVQFDKTPIPLVLAQTSSNRWLILFPPRQMGFTGKNPPPTRFLWLYLPDALAGNPLPERFKFSRKPEGGWRLENVKSRESLEGYIEP